MSLGRNSAPGGTPSQVKDPTLKGVTKLRFPIGPAGCLSPLKGLRAPLERAGRLPLGQASKREEAGLP